MDGISITPVRGKHLSPGWYIARHRRSPPGTRWSIVQIYHLKEGSVTNVVVFQASAEAGEPESPKNWRFRSRILGVESIPDRPKPVPKVEAAQVIPFPRRLTVVGLAP